MSQHKTKPTKWHLCPGKDQTGQMLGCPPVWSESSLCAQWIAKDKLFSCRQRRLIRLGRCPGWSESLLGAHALLLVLSCAGSIILDDGTRKGFFSHLWTAKAQLILFICAVRSSVATDVDYNHHQSLLPLVIDDRKVFFFFTVRKFYF